MVKRGHSNSPAEAKNAAPPEVQRSPATQAAIDAFAARAEAEPVIPDVALKERDDGVFSLSFDHADQIEAITLFGHAFGLSNIGPALGLINQVANANREEDGGVRQVNFAKDMIAGIAPRDAVETMLATQMASVHVAAMRHLRMLRNVDNIPQLEIQERTVNKLTRTFAAQVEALRKYRTGGQQNVEVRHVHVNEGGQAIVGNVTTGGRDERKE